MDAEKIIDDLISYMSFTQPWKPNEKYDSTHVVPVKYFDGAIYYSAKDDNPLTTNEKVFHPGDVSINDLSNPFDLCIIGESGNEKYLFDMQRFRRVTPKEVRGKVKKIYPSMILHSIGRIRKEDMGIFTQQGTFYYAGKHRWKDNGVVGIMPGLENDLSQRIEMAISVQFTLFYQWKVYVSFDNNPGICFMTNPEGAKEIFKLRDIPPGYKRRQALRNWVCEHSRITKHGETTVKEHLRGKQEFEWNGMRCIIVPSQYDLQRNQKKV